MKLIPLTERAARAVRLAPNQRRLLGNASPIWHQQVASPGLGFALVDGDASFGIGGVTPI